MKLSNFQALVLLQLLKDSLNLKDNCGRVFSFNDEYRLRLYNEIMNQQSSILKELDGEEEDGTSLLRPRAKEKNG